MDKKDKKEGYSEAQLSSIWNYKFKNAMIHKAEYTKKWQTYFDAYKGDYFKNENLPDYRSNMVSNYIFSIIETIRPIMLDNDPKFQALPRQPEGIDFANDLQEALMYEWDREGMNKKLYRELINTLVIGNSIFFVPWSSEENNVKAVPVNPFNIFPDPLATSIDDTEYIIYANYMNVEILKRFFPEKSDKLHGGSVNYSELVYENNKNANIDNQVLVLEIWTRDYETEDKIINNDIKETKARYPNGRVITLCPELGLVLSDKANNYKSADTKKQRRFPFIIIKDYDIPGKFWGEGEVEQLLSPQKYMNELNNSIVDNAKSTANMPWIVDKNSGVGVGKITARPGLVIRKNPNSEIRREQPPSMPTYVINAVETYKDDLEMISGVHNTLRGENSSGVYTAQGILALQEAGTVRIRLKVKLLESALADLAEIWVDRMKQFWKDDKWLRISKVDGSYDLKMFTKEVLEYDYDVKITAGSTMPVNRGAMLDLMIRLAQTQMPDGQPLVDREAVVNYLPEEIKAPLLKRMGDNQSSLAEIQQAIQELGQAIEEINQVVEQVSQEGQQQDDEQFKLIEELMSAVEGLNEQILQLSDEYDKMVEEGKEENRIKKIQDDYYNKGYSDAESIYDDMLGTSEDEGDIVGEGDIEDTNSMEMPEEMLMGIENMSDEELSLLVEKYPNILELIK